MNSESQQIQQLKARYKESMPEKVGKLTEHLKVLLELDKPSQEIYDTIKADVHKLAGSLGMYGYNHLAKQARDTMSIIDKQEAESLQHELLSLRNLLRKEANS